MNKDTCNEKAQDGPQTGAMRMNAENMLKDRIRRLEAEQKGLVSLLIELPRLSDAADEALWNLLVQRR